MANGAAALFMRTAYQNPASYFGDTPLAAAEWRRSAEWPSFWSALTGVRDLADQLLQHVFEENHAGYRALNVDDTSQVGSGELHGCQYVLDLIIGLHGGQTPHSFDRHRLAALGVIGIQDVLEVQVAGDLAGGISDRKAGEPSFGHQPLDIVRSGAQRKGDQLAQRHRHVGGHPVTEFQNTPRHTVSISLDQTLAVALRDDEMDLLGGEGRRQLVLGLDAQSPDHRLRQPLHQPNHRAQHPGAGAFAAVHHQGCPLRAGDREVLGHHLADDDVQINHDQQCCLLYTSDAADDLLCVDLGG